MTASPQAELHPLDAMTAARDHHDVLLENDQLRVLDTNLRPGQRTPVHAHQWPAALYILSWSDFLRRDEAGNILVDSRKMERRPAPGEALWLPPLMPHTIENIGDADLHIVAVEVKAAQLS